MALTRVDHGIQYFPQFIAGKPIASAQIYVGVPDLDPSVLANQVQAYVVQENGTQVAVAQPIQTSAGGVPTYNGSPVQIAVAETAYSVKVLNSLGTQIYYQPNNTDLSQIDAAQVSYTADAIGAETTTQSEYNQRRVYLQDFMTAAQRMNVYLRLGTLDVTDAWKASVAHSILHGVPVYDAGGVHLITDELTVAAKTQLVGTHNSQSAIDNGSKILFQPTSVKNLFDAGPTGAFKDGYNISGFQIVGNSASAVGNSSRAFNLIKVIKSRFTNLRIDGFREAFRLEATINNRFEFAQMANNYVANINYTGDTATTDVWEQCYISNAPIGVQTNGSNVGIRFSKCIFETLTTYGINICRESYGIMLDNCYTEDVNSGGSATSAFARVGYDGTTLAGSTQLIINGGVYGGRNAGGAGSFLDVDFTDGVCISGLPLISRFTNGIKTTANTQNDQVVSGGFTCASVGNIITGPATISGTYPIGTFNSSTRNRQQSTLVGDIYISPTTATTGAITPSVSYTVIKEGTLVTLVLPPTAGVAVATTYFEYGNLLPARMRPTSVITGVCAILDGGINLATPGMIFILTTGEVRVYKDLTAAANFTAGLSAGIGQSSSSSISWSV